MEAEDHKSIQEPEEVRHISLEDEEDGEEYKVLIKPFASKNGANGKKLFATWKDLMLREELIKGLLELDFQYPSEIQFKAIPQITNSRRADLVCQAKSGMGKTAVFLVALLEMLKKEEGDDYLPHQYIIITNTREMAHQIYKQLNILASYFRNPQLRTIAVFGGQSTEQNRSSLRSKEALPHIIVGTLGRLRHMFEERSIQARNVKCIVIDECDALIGREDSNQEIRFLLSITPKDKQLLMFTAILSERVKQECLELMRKEPAPVVVHHSWNLQTINHFYLCVVTEKKHQKAMEVLEKWVFNQAIVFTNTIERAIRVTEILMANGFNPICMHSGLSQKERIIRYDLFKSNGNKLIVATDLFGRGVDIDHVNLIINYDFPQRAGTYLHRAGRAGRFGKTGTCITLIDSNQDQEIAQLKQYHNVSLQELRRNIKKFDL